MEVSRGRKANPLVAKLAPTVVRLSTQRRKAPSKVGKHLMGKQPPLGKKRNARRRGKSLLRVERVRPREEGSRMQDWLPIRRGSFTAKTVPLKAPR